MRKVLLFIICALLFISHSYAQDAEKLSAITGQIMEAGDNHGLYLALEEATDLYFNENKYNEFVEFLNSLVRQKEELGPAVNYYIALSRYHQLKFLEQVQSWDEYFNKGNLYRDQITEGLKKALSVTGPAEALNIHARLLSWQFHRDREDALRDASLTELMDAVLEYCKAARDLEPVKDAADRLFYYGEKAKARELYKTYVRKMVTLEIKDEGLEKVALDSYKEGNIELTQNLYDIYIERISAAMPQEKLIPVLINLANLFVYKEEGPNEPAYAEYAEKIFSKIEELEGKKAFDEGLIYLRAFNLEKAKEYSKAKDLYLTLLSRFPESRHSDEANFKLGIIYTYILRDKKTGEAYFKNCAQNRTVNPCLVSGLYQLGLLAQWEGNNVLAQDYYHELIEKAGARFSYSAALAQQRLKEIEESEPLDYNLKTFLDVSFKDEYATLDMAQLGLTASSYILKKGEEVNITSYAHIQESGCMQPEIKYIWSGDTGKIRPAIDAPSFTTNYTWEGTNLVNLVVVSPTGIVERNLLLLDVR